MCSHQFAQYHEEGDNFLKWIITGDETWVNHYQQQTKQKNTQWKHPPSPVA
jgi:hypothetical protein